MVSVVALSSAPSSASTVSVAPGETLLGIADQFGTTVASLEAANNLADPNTILAGSVLQVPGSAGVVADTPNNAVVVQPGQTLSSIAASFHTTVAALASTNNLIDPNNIVVGSVLRIPGPGSPAPTATTASGSGGSVVVAAGDTLMGIAHQYGTTVAALATANNLADPNTVVIGSVLKIPGAGASATGPLASGTSGVTVTISPGQTLSSIAANHGTTVAMLEAVNGIVHPNLIVSGMQLRLPPASTSALASDIVPAGSALPAPLRAHPGRVALRPLFSHWAGVEGVSPALLEAMCWWESGWQTYISSVTGALGVCQLEPSTVTQLQAQLGQSTLDPNVASDNIEMAAAFLHQLMVATAGNVSTALAGYYQGLASVQSAGLLPSTKQYVKGILAYVPSFS
jgi:LysM repeat protein